MKRLDDKFICRKSFFFLITFFVSILITSTGCQSLIDSFKDEIKDDIKKDLQDDDSSGDSEEEKHAKERFFENYFDDKNVDKESFKDDHSDLLSASVKEHYDVYIFDENETISIVDLIKQKYNKDTGNSVSGVTLSPKRVDIIRKADMSTKKISNGDSIEEGVKLQDGKLSVSSDAKEGEVAYFIVNDVSAEGKEAIKVLTVLILEISKKKDGDGKTKGHVLTRSDIEKKVKDSSADIEKKYSFEISFYSHKKKSISLVDLIRDNYKEKDNTNVDLSKLETTKPSVSPSLEGGLSIDKGNLNIYPDVTKGKKYYLINYDVTKKDSTEKVSVSVKLELDIQWSDDWDYKKYY